jgi:hypothetical protein
LGAVRQEGALVSCAVYVSLILEIFKEQSLQSLELSCRHRYIAKVKFKETVKLAGVFVIFCIHIDHESTHRVLKNLDSFDENVLLFL